MSSEAQPRPRVLFVDDSAACRLAVVQALAALHTPMDTAGSLAEARALELSVYSVVLLDLELGDGVGPDLAIELQAAPVRPEIGFLSAADAGPLRQRAESIGPVFDKVSELEKAVRWVTEQLK